MASASQARTSGNLTPWHWLALIGLFVLTFFAYDYHNILSKRPQGIHQSRQTDGASYTLNYYQNERPFLKPQTHTLTGKEGNAASEFPVIYYFTAQLYKVFGPEEWLLRLVHLVFFYAGLLALFALSLRLIQQRWLALLVPILVLVSPYIIYYANNFLPNVPSLSLVFIGWWAFFRYRDTERVGWWYFMGLAFTFAALLKIPAGISMASLMALWILGSVGWGGVVPQPRKKWIHYLAVFGVFMGAVLAWYLYARAYNEVSGTGQNLLGLLPIWKLGGSGIAESLYHIWSYWWPHYLMPETQGLLLVIASVLIVKRKRVDKTLLWILGWLSMGVFFYSLLWFVAFRDHDYYLINLFILPVFVLIAFLKYAKEHVRIRKTSVKAVFIGATALLVFWNIWNTREMQQSRYYGGMYEGVNEALFTMEPYLRSIGVGEDELVMVLGDPFPNRSLYLINNFGWTEAFTDPAHYNIYHFINQGVEYLIVTDSSYLNNEYYQPFYYTNEGTWAQIGEYQGVLIFDLRDKEF